MIDLSGARVTVMGLGLHGGGLASAHYLLERGAEVTITDLRTEQELAGSLDQLGGAAVRLVLGGHELSDFRDADIVLKNPAVRRSSPYVTAARRIETDISLFLYETSSPLICVTGSKGKSSTAGAIYAALQPDYPGARLGGNITTSPLTFLHELTAQSPVVLELSSFQLGDLALSGEPAGSAAALLKPQVAVLTNIYRDHQDYYDDMASYVSDKLHLVRHAAAGACVVLPADCAYTPQFIATTHARTCIVDPAGDIPLRSRSAFESPSAYRAVAAEEGRWMLRTGSSADPAHDDCLVDRETAVVGSHMRRNLATAGLALYAWGMAPASIRERLRHYPGMEHRLEYVDTVNGIMFYNDTAATIPEAALEAVRSFETPVHLIAGGSDKALDLKLFLNIAAEAAEIALLAGTATERIAARLGQAGLSWYGPYNDMEECVAAVAARAREKETVLLSPGCASFGMFKNEFDRGTRFKSAVYRLSRETAEGGTSDTGHEAM